MYALTHFFILCPVFSYFIYVSHPPFLHIKALLSQHLHQSKRQGNDEGNRKHCLLGVTGFHCQWYLFVLENILCCERMFVGSGQSNETLEARQAWPPFACIQHSLNKPSRIPTWSRKNEDWIEINPGELTGKQVKVLFLLPLDFSSKVFCLFVCFVGDLFFDCLGFSLCKCGTIYVLFK